MDRRLELNQLLRDILGSGNVYFQPPSSVQMSYPAIVYSRDSVKTEYANDLPYLNRNRYKITVIDRNPDSKIPDSIAKLPLSKFSTSFVVDNLNHTIFSLYF